MNQKARLAWELYLKMGTSSDSFSLLQVIANDCYKVLQRLTQQSLMFTASVRNVHIKSRWGGHAPGGGAVSPA